MCCGKERRIIAYDDHKCGLCGNEILAGRAARRLGVTYHIHCALAAAQLNLGAIDVTKRAESPDGNTLAGKPQG